MNDKKKFESDYAEESGKIKNRWLISFFKDKTFTLFSEQGVMKSGKWYFNEENGSGGFSATDLKDIFIVHTDTASDEKMITLVNSKALTKKVFSKFGEPTKDSRKEPYSISNNEWRIKPAYKENDEQLKNRLAGYFQHVIYVLEASEESGLNVVSLEFSMGIIKIYNSAIGIISYNKVPEYWISSFYDETDARKAYDMYEKYLQNYSYRGSRSSNWVDNDIRILKSILFDMKNGKF